MIELPNPRALLATIEGWVLGLLARGSRQADYYGKKIFLIKKRLTELYIISDCYNKT